MTREPSGPAAKARPADASPAGSEAGDGGLAVQPVQHALERTLDDGLHRGPTREPVQPFDRVAERPQERAVIGRLARLRFIDRRREHLLLGLGGQARVRRKAVQRPQDQHLSGQRLEEVLRREDVGAAERHEGDTIGADGRRLLRRWRRAGCRSGLGASLGDDSEAEHRAVQHGPEVPAGGPEARGAAPRRAARISHQSCPNDLAFAASASAFATCPSPR